MVFEWEKDYLGKILTKFIQSLEIRLLQYMKELLLLGEWEEVAGEATVVFWLEGGLECLKGRYRRQDRKVECVGHILSEGLRCIGPERVQGNLEELLSRAEGGL